MWALLCQKNGSLTTESSFCHGHANALKPINKSCWVSLVFFSPKGADNFGADCIFTKNITWDFDINLIPIFICWYLTLCQYINLHIFNLCRLYYTFIQESCTFTLAAKCLQIQCQYLHIIRFISSREEAVRIIMGYHFNKLHFIWTMNFMLLCLMFYPVYITSFFFFFFIRFHVLVLLVQLQIEPCIFGPYQVLTFVTEPCLVSTCLELDNKKLALLTNCGKCLSWKENWKRETLVQQMTSQSHQYFEEKSEQMAQEHMSRSAFVEIKITWLIV